jgi:hypothetical protein
LFLARRFREEIEAALALDPGDLPALRDLVEYYLLAPGVARSGRRAYRRNRRTRGIPRRVPAAGFHKRAAEVEACLRKAAESLPPGYRARIALAQFYLAEHRDALRLYRGRVDAYSVLACKLGLLQKTNPVLNV